MSTTTAGSEAGSRPMRAIVQHRYGTDPSAVLEHTETARPTIGPAEVLVRVAATSVDMGTWHCLSGRPYAMRLAGFGVRAPKASNPGRAFAGTVEAVGREVADLEPGDEVYGTGAGAFAAYVCAEAGMVSRKPANLSFEQAAAAPISGVTALQAVRKADIQPGQKVLVLGASGGVGVFAVQLAKASGAEVTGVCSTPKVDLVRGLGVDHVVEYARQDIADGHVRYDVILDTGGNRRLASLRRVLTERGRLVIVGGETGGRWLGGYQRSLAAVLLSPFVSHELGMLTSKENAADLGALRAFIEEGAVTPVLDRTYALADTALAIARLHGGTAIGKVIIRVPA